MKLWQKANSKKTNEIIDKFTVGKDRELDINLAPFDLFGSMAHAIMLTSIDLLEKQELKSILQECKIIYNEDIKQGKFEIIEGIEDVHSQIEYILTTKIGDIGKKIHSGRSRNDQVLVDMKMYLRHKIEEIVLLTEDLFKALQEKSELHKNDLLPGYTHLQIAMPSSFGLWFGAYAESLVDDLISLQSVYKIVNKNPLGSGAGYGSNFPLKRHLTKDLLGFDDLNYNVVYAQMTRGKMEFLMAQALGVFANTLSKMAMDVCLYNSQNFGFINLPEEMTTGSSIMPHKKNPDVAEILRGKANKLKGLASEIAFVQTNLPSGYHREMQLIKEIIMPALDDFSETLSVATFMIKNLKIKENLLDDSKFDLLFSVENVNKKVIEGMPFRDAYRAIGGEIEAGTYQPIKTLNHTLEGSIGNLCNPEIKEMMNNVIQSFNFEKVHQAFENLLNFEVE
ncbi:argininosuccinate lyase [Lacihabitans sp. CS3-21]|uniref:argininosuccinate lyase n=1 Tax=Lacihabitans sp. CS3-21 TaxID=2487332 RepID=UPI0020CF28C4|nr:argininosuccinate lyase [Lacihabitans sp. CS3-21]MCP9746118.1 argininosuccinate lyase [Lacihabitans sp. CS3-21]